MEKQKVAEFFDRCAPWWDADMIRNEERIAAILNNAGVKPGMHVLDVACGTGVLFPDYLNRGVASVTAIDLSREMVKIASEKFPQVQVLCGDVEETEFSRQFDCVMVYNAFPHFPDPARLIARLASLVKPGGKLSVAHGMSREALTSHHAGRASEVSIDLIHERELSKLFSRWFDVDVVISTDQMYQVAGVRRGAEPRMPAAVPSQATPLEELQALLRYTVQHNDAHAQELAMLASQIQQEGRQQAYRKIMEAVADFDTVNARLNAVLQDLDPEDA